MLRCVGEVHKIKAAVDSETVAALERLLQQAQQGQAVGLAYVVLHQGHDYSGDVVGHATAHPLLVRGIVGALADLVASYTPKNR